MISDILKGHCLYIRLLYANNNMDFFVERDKAAKALKVIKEFLDINYISYEKYPEIESQKDKLLSLLPKNIQLEQNDLNLYYSLFRKQLK